MAKSGAGAPANVRALALQVLALALQVLALALASTCVLYCKYWHLQVLALALQVLACYIASTGTCKYLHLQYNTKNTTFSTDNYAAILIQANAQADMRAIELPLHMTRAQRVPNTRPLPEIFIRPRCTWGPIDGSCCK